MLSAPSRPSCVRGCAPHCSLWLNLCLEDERYKNSPKDCSKVIFPDAVHFIIIPSPLSPLTPRDEHLQRARPRLAGSSRNTEQHFGVLQRLGRSHAAQTVGNTAGIAIHLLANPKSRSRAQPEQAAQAMCMCAHARTITHRGPTGGLKQVKIPAASFLSTPQHKG